MAPATLPAAEVRAEMLQSLQRQATRAQAARAALAVPGLRIVRNGKRVKPRSADSPACGWRRVHATGAAHWWPRLERFCGCGRHHSDEAGAVISTSDARPPRSSGSCYDLAHL